MIFGISYSRALPRGNWWYFERSPSTKIGEVCDIMYVEVTTHRNRYVTGLLLTILDQREN